MLLWMILLYFIASTKPKWYEWFIFIDMMNSNNIKWVASSKLSQGHAHSAFLWEILPFGTAPFFVESKTDKKSKHSATSLTTPGKKLILPGKDD